MDVWADFQQLFGLQLADIYPAIRIHGLEPHSQENILRHIFKHVMDVEPIFEDIETGAELYPSSVDSMINHILSEDVYGMVWVDIKMDGLTLPPLGLISDYSSLSIHYIMGMWTPITLIALLELLRWIKERGDNISVRMERETAPKRFCKQFDKAWQSYLNDKRCK